MASIDRLPSGRWRVRWQRPDGKSGSKTLPNRRDARLYGIKMESDIAITGTYVDPSAGRVTFTEYAERWRDLQTHRASTREQVRLHLENHVYPAIGDRAIGTIRPSDLKALISAMNSTLAPSTVNTVWRYVVAVFRSAVEDRIISSSPATRSVKPPKIEKRPVTIPTTDQVHTIATRVPERFRAMILLAAGSGLRQGELFGLGVDPVDWPRRQVHVERQLVQISGGPPTLQRPKTEASRRTVPLPDVVLTGLAAHLEAFPADNDHGLLFTAARGGLIRRNGWSQDVWQPAVEGLSFPARTGMHSLPHFYASALIRHGESVTVVQHRLGHASASETLDTYAHLWPDSAEQTRSALTAELGESEAAQSGLCHDRTG